MLSRLGEKLTRVWQEGSCMVPLTTAAWEENAWGNIALVRIWHKDRCIEDTQARMFKSSTRGSHDD